MKKNVGNVDKAVRIILAIVFTALYFTNTVNGTVAYVVLGLAVVFLLTSLVGFCPLYALVGLNTCPAKKQ